MDRTLHCKSCPLSCFQFAYANSRQIEVQKQPKTILKWFLVLSSLFVLLHKLNVLNMILSMTGYGKAVVTYKGKKINVEVKSLNSKNLDLSTRIAPLYREKEMEIRQTISKTLERGKVDFSLWVEKDAALDATPINAELVENYYNQIKQISAQTGIPEPMDWYTTLLRLPDVTTKTEVEVLDDEEWEAAKRRLKKPLNIISNSESKKEQHWNVSLTRRLIISKTY